MLQTGDVVYVEGARAILGDVLDVDEENGTADVSWRACTTTEVLEELISANTHA